MKHLCTLLLAFCALKSLAQDADYYQKSYSKPIGSKPYNAESFLRKLGEVRILNRWYLGADGFIQKDRNTITNDFDGLIATESPTVTAWGANLGWIYREQYAFELAYNRSAVHNILIINGYNPMRFKIENDKNALMIRAKRRIIWGKKSLRRPAFWISGGIGMIPNSGREKDYMQFAGYRERGRQVVDTLSLSSDTQISRSVTGLAEISAEYVVKVAKIVDLSIFARKQFGLANSMTTNLAYSVNGQEPETSSITGDGTGWNFGLSLRYVFAMRYDLSVLGH